MSQKNPQAKPSHLPRHGLPDVQLRVRPLRSPHHRQHEHQPQQPAGGRLHGRDVHRHLPPLPGRLLLRPLSAIKILGAILVSLLAE